MANQFRPMLAAPADFNKLRFPVLGSPKLDGVRALVKDGVVLSRSLKPIPNKRVQLQFGRKELNGYDGELIVGNPWSETVYNDTIREVMTIDGPCTCDYYVFDRHDMPFHYGIRRGNLHAHSRVHVLVQKELKSIDEILAHELAHIDIGYEGLILRDPLGSYKNGRSTVNEGWLLKLKRFHDSEAEIIGMEELMHNANVAETSEIGLTKRSTHQENKHGLDTMGALWVKDIVSGVIFKVGTGFTAEQRAWFWQTLKLTGEFMPDPLTGAMIPLVERTAILIKYKYFAIGVKDKPRHPVYLGLRDLRDM